MLRLLGNATLAQSVERLTRNEKVDSSILSSGSESPRCSSKARMPRVFLNQKTHSLFKRSADVSVAQMPLSDSDYGAPAPMRQSRAGGGIGRRAGFRFLYLRMCGFKSHLAHSLESFGLFLRTNHLYSHQHSHRFHARSIVGFHVAHAVSFRLCRARMPHRFQRILGVKGRLPNIPAPWARSHESPNTRNRPTFCCHLRRVTPPLTARFRVDSRKCALWGRSERHHHDFQPEENIFRHKYTSSRSVGRIRRTLPLENAHESRKSVVEASFEHEFRRV